MRSCALYSKYLMKKNEILHFLMYNNNFDFYCIYDVNKQ